MKRKRFKETAARTIAVALITSAGLAASCLTAAAPLMGFTVQVDPMYMAVFGKDEQIATINRIPVPVAGAPATSTTEGVDLDMDGDFAIRGEAQYLVNRWGVGANGFWFNPEGDVDRIEDLGGFAQVNVASNNVVAFASNFVGAPNRVTYSADNDLEVWSADFYGIRTLAETPDSHVHMRAGLKIAGIDDEFSERAQQGTVAGGVFTPNRVITALSSADTGVLVGPLVGVSGDASVDQHRVKGLLQQSMLFGETDRATRTEVDTAPLGTVNQIRTFDSDHDVGVPVTEVGIKYLYDVTENVALGLGGFASVWWDVPTAGGSGGAAQNNGDGTGVSSPEETLVFLGGMGSIEARF